MSPRCAAAEFETDVKKGDRFRFGKNWQRFLSLLSDKRIVAAQQSLQQMLGLKSLQGKSFLDVGSGSGLFSLAAMRLGADRVCSIDFDPQSVECARELKRRYFSQAENWEILQGCVLDASLLTTLGTWDIVYSWGVLHHTGKMWDALANVTPLVASGGQLFISIYNDMGPASRRWRKIKAFYNWNVATRWLVCCLGVPYFYIRSFIGDLLKGRSIYHEYRDSPRGMSMYHDIIDWLGGHPYEFAKPEEIFDFFLQRRFALERLTTCAGGWGCNQFVFRQSVGIHNPPVS